MTYIVIQKERLQICSEQSIPVPMSHVFESRGKAILWMMDRGMSGYCEVIDIARFRALNGWGPPQPGIEMYQQAMPPRTVY